MLLNNNTEKKYRIGLLNAQTETGKKRPGKAAKRIIFHPGLKLLYRSANDTAIAVKQ